MTDRKSNLEALTTFVTVGKFLIEKRIELLEIAKQEAASGFGISEDTMETFTYVNDRIKHYKFRPAAPEEPVPGDRIAETDVDQAFAEVEPAPAATGPATYHCYFEFINRVVSEFDTGSTTPEGAMHASLTRYAGCNGGEIVLAHPKWVTTKNPRGVTLRYDVNERVWEDEPR